MKEKAYVSVTLMMFLGLSVNSFAEPVEYVKVCPSYGAAFHYIPGTDICVNEQTGETRQATPGGTWTSLLPTNNQGKWTLSPATECGTGRLVPIGTYKPSDFQFNAYEQYQTAPFALKLGTNEFISKVMMSGGFSDPGKPGERSSRLGPNQFCLRTADPNFHPIDNGVANPQPFCTSAPLGCVSNSEILGTPAAYSFSVFGTPVVHYDTDMNGTPIGSPTTCGSQLVLTTGMGRFDITQVRPGVAYAGTVTVSVCIETSSPFARF